MVADAWQFTLERAALSHDAGRQRA
jgi:hypothetical protein